MKTATYCGVEVLSEAECRQIVDRKLKTNEAEILEVKTRPLSAEVRAGYLGDHYLVTITVTDKCQPIELHFFAKIAPTSAIHNDMAVKIGAYKKETHFFSVLMLDLMKYDEGLDNGGRIQPDWSCNCYLTTPSKIVLDDMSAQGYRNHGHRLFMDKEHCVLVLQTLARFHAAFIVFEEKETLRTGEVCRLNEVYPDQFEESMWVRKKGHPTMKIFEAGINSSIALLKYLPGVKEDEGRVEELAKRMWASFEDACSLINKPSKNLRYAVSHGDMWTNNILIRYDNEKPVDVKFVDFQIVRYTAPANDVITFLHLNTRRRLRDQHLLELTRTYHDTLRAELTRHHLDVDSILPWDQFETSLELYREMATFTANFYFPLVQMSPEMMEEGFATEENFQKFMYEDRTREVCQCFETDLMFREVVTESMEELIEHLDRRQYES